MEISTLGQNINRIRLEKKMSKYELSKKAEVGASTISQIENGKRQTLKGDTINKIAHALNVSVNELLTNDDIINFETNDICDLLSIMLGAEFLELDGVKFSDTDKLLLETNLTMFINSIRYNRLKLNKR